MKLNTSITCLHGGSVGIEFRRRKYRLAICLTMSEETEGAMAITRVSTNIALQPPEKFCFRNPDGWLKWKRRFQQFLTASCLDKQNDERKISTLLYCLGDDADEVLTSTSITDEERSSYDRVIQKLDEFFKVRRNKIYERARFNRRDQKKGESAEAYITELYKLVESCEYGTMKNELLRDRLVVGIADKKLSEQLQIDADLTLEKAKKIIRQKEAVHEQSSDLMGRSNPSLNLDAIREKRGGSKRPKGGSKYQPQTSTSHQPQSSEVEQERWSKRWSKLIVCCVVNLNTALKTKVQPKMLVASDVNS